MLDGEETVEIACGELRLEGAIQHAGRRGNRGNSLRELRWEGAIYSMLDGEETVERGGSDTTCWTERKPWK